MPSIHAACFSLKLSPCELLATIASSGFVIVLANVLQGSAA